MLDFTQINLLKTMLENAGIPFEMSTHFEGYQIIYPNCSNPVCDVILHKGSYGHEQGLLEIMGLVDEEKVGDEVEGFLTAKECFNRIEKHYNNITK